MEIKRTQIMSKELVERGQIIQDDNAERYLIVKVNRDKNAIRCLDNKFNFCSIGLDFLKNYTYIETIDMGIFTHYVINGD